MSEPVTIRQTAGWHGQAEIFGESSTWPKKIDTGAKVLLPARRCGRHVQLDHWSGSVEWRGSVPRSGAQSAKFQLETASFQTVSFFAGRFFSARTVPRHMPVLPA